MSFSPGKNKRRLLYFGLGLAPFGAVSVSLVYDFIPYSKPTGFVLSLAIDIAYLDGV